VRILEHSRRAHRLGALHQGAVRDEIVKRSAHVAREAFSHGDHPIAREALKRVPIPSRDPRLMMKSVLALLPTLVLRWMSRLRDASGTDRYGGS
jgi:hypothetical protein